MILKDSKLASVCLISQVKSFGVIWDHLESFESWGDKISYTIKMQDALSFFGQTSSISQTKFLVGTFLYHFLLQDGSKWPSI